MKPAALLSMPDVVDGLIDLLDRLNPEHSPEAGETLEALHRRGGRRDLVRELIAARKAQLDKRAKED